MALFLVCASIAIWVTVFTILIRECVESWNRNCITEFLFLFLILTLLTVCGVVMGVAIHTLWNLGLIV